jgi:hypothetical protein
LTFPPEHWGEGHEKAKDTEKNAQAQQLKCRREQLAGEIQEHAA